MQCDLGVCISVRPVHSSTVAYFVPFKAQAARCTSEPSRKFLDMTKRKEQSSHRASKPCRVGKEEVARRATSQEAYLGHSGFWCRGSSKEESIVYLQIVLSAFLLRQQSLLQASPVTSYVAEHREAVWLVGPLFASLTGLGIKEGLCYGTPAAIGITLVTPLLCLGHLSGLMPEAGTTGLLVILNAFAIWFAAGKYGQPIRGDIGDKSIFEVQALPKEEQEKRWAALRESRSEAL